MKSILLFLLSVLASHPASADENSVPPPGSSIAAELDDRPNSLPPSQRLVGEFWGNFATAGVDNLSASSTPNADGSSGSQKGLNNGTASLRYLLDSDLSIGPIQNFGAGPRPGTYASSGDLGFSVRQNRLFKKGIFSVGGELGAYLPTSLDSRQKTIRGSLRTTLTLLVDLPDARASLGVYGFAQLNPYGSLGKAAGADLVYVYVAPFAQYKLAKGISASAWLDFLSLHRHPATNSVLLDGITLKTGLAFDITRQVNLNPYVNIAPGRLAARTTYVGTFLNVRI